MRRTCCLTLNTLARARISASVSPWELVAISAAHFRGRNIMASARAKLVEVGTNQSHPFCAT